MSTDAFLAAARRGDAAAVAAALRAGTDPSAPDVYGNTALHYAAVAGEPPLLRALLAAGATVNATNNNSFTPLHLAAMEANYDAAIVLIRAGAGLTVKSAEGTTPLDYVPPDVASQLQNIASGLASLRGPGDVSSSTNGYASAPPTDGQRELAQQRSPLRANNPGHGGGGGGTGSPSGFGRPGSELSSTLVRLEGENQRLRAQLVQAQADITRLMAVEASLTKQVTEMRIELDARTVATDAAVAAGLSPAYHSREPGGGSPYGVGRHVSYGDNTSHASPLHLAHTEHEFLATEKLHRMERTLEERMRDFEEETEARLKAVYAQRSKELEADYIRRVNELGQRELELSRRERGLSHDVDSLFDIERVPLAAPSTSFGGSPVSGRSFQPSPSTANADSMIQNLVSRVEQALSQQHESETSGGAGGLASSSLKIGPPGSGIHPQLHQFTRPTLLTPEQAAEREKEMIFQRAQAHAQQRIQALESMQDRIVHGLIVADRARAAQGLPTSGYAGGGVSGVCGVTGFGGGDGGGGGGGGGARDSSSLLSTPDRNPYLAGSFGPLASSPAHLMGGPHPPHPQGTPATPGAPGPPGPLGTPGTPQ